MVFIKIIFGNAENMRELSDESVHLVVTSPPYYNAPFDFPELFESYEEYLRLIKNVGKEIYRVLQKGRIASLVIQDVRIEGKLYPIVSDLIYIMTKKIGFDYRDKIIWKKPEGYVRISKRSGVLIQHPYPMYFYPDNIYEEIVIFQKGKFKYDSIPEEIRARSKINTDKFLRQKWYLSIWSITNVLPSEKWSKFTAAYPETLVERLITLYSYVGETVLDPFMGTGTTAIVARKLRRNCIGYEIDLELRPVIEERLTLSTKLLTTFMSTNESDDTEIIVREDAKRLRTNLHILYKVNYLQKRGKRKQ